MYVERRCLPLAAHPSCIEHRGGRQNLLTKSSLRFRPNYRASIFPFLSCLQGAAGGRRGRNRSCTTGPNPTRNCSTRACRSTVAGGGARHLPRPVRLVRRDTSRHNRVLSLLFLRVALVRCGPRHTPTTTAVQPVLFRPVSRERDQGRGKEVRILHAFNIHTLPHHILYTLQRGSGDPVDSRCNATRHGRPLQQGCKDW